jgi:formate dehydrogenase subunit gamma
MTTQAGSLTDVVSAAVAAHRGEPGPLLAILHDVQRELGHLPREATALLAEQLNLSRADVHGVVTFYKDFRDTPPARRTVRICRAEACQARGARDLVAHAERRLGVPVGGASPDGSVELGQVFCFGNCALGPAVEVDGRLHGRVDAARFDELVAD